MTSPTPKEIQLNNPKTFDGDRNNLNKFIQSCNAYLELNADIFNSDKRKILFVLSYMTEGTAEAWKEVFMDEKNRTYGGYTNNSRRPSLQLMPKEKHEHSYNNSDREKTQQTNILHNSGSSQDVPRSQTTNSLLKFYRRFLVRTHSQP